MEMDRKPSEGDSQGAIEVSTQPTNTTSSPDEVRASKVITTYLLAQSKEFQQLSQLRQQGWENPEGDKFFAQQRAQADFATAGNSEEAKRAAQVFFRMMQNVGNELHKSTGAFTVSEPVGKHPKFLELGMAPGDFLSAAMEHNPDASATAYSLPVEAGGYEVLLPQSPGIDTRMLDVTMLAADMDADAIPEGHPDLANFLPRHFNGIWEFDVVSCGGSVVRSHSRAAYRALSETHRLSVTQLALGLGQLRRGGTMIVLLHKPEAPGTVETLHLFSQFSSIQLFKSTKAHAKRSAFYMVATNVQVEHPEAVKAVQSWKHLFNVATFGGEGEFKQLVHKDNPWVEGMVNDFGPALVRLGKPIWAIQARALANAPFTKKPVPASQSSHSWRRESK